MNRSGRRDARMRRNTTADQIKQLIISRELQPGDAMPTETELCEILDVSRSSVREAMRTLSTLDIVEVRHGHGTFVGQMSLDAMVEALVFRGVLSPGGSLQALREVVEVRLALDLALTDRVVGTELDETCVEELEELVATMVAKAKAGEMFLDEDRAFHTRLFESTSNRLAGQLIGAFWDVHTAVLPQLHIGVPEDIRSTAQAHGDMLAAAVAGDADAYRLAVLEHYQPLQRVLAERG
ncbi:FadR/GntR family transcriptional regulator [Agrococcus beijingensis]|uniref:FadR/GntR family transcriptional regulator n=1 Tax=Agrococcus beijingensis TaxID=3068634 RepID=UPI0027428D39|nr:GntR family transcriptional regulator [Agrococcus sp. REN33]